MDLDMLFPVLHRSLLSVPLLPAIDPCPGPNLVAGWQSMLPASCLQWCCYEVLCTTSIEALPAI